LTGNEQALRMPFRRPLRKIKINRRGFEGVEEENKNWPEACTLRKGEIKHEAHAAIARARNALLGNEG
jgi:hypothetical protein